jgi:hypothetical protein
VSGDFQILHFIPGRIRFRLGRVKDNLALAEEIQRKLASAPGVHKARANPITGSVLVLYEPSRTESADSWLQIGRELDLFPDGFDDLQSLYQHQQTSAAKPSQQSPDLEKLVDELFLGLDDKVARASHGRASLSDFVPLAFFLLGLRKFLLSKAAPIPWHTYLWYAFGIYRSFHATHREREVD